MTGSVADEFGGKKSTCQDRSSGSLLLSTPRENLSKCESYLCVRRAEKTRVLVLPSVELL